MVENANRKPGYDGNRFADGTPAKPYPTKLSIALGPNEFAKGLTLSQARDRITRSSFIFHHQGRKAFPNADIAFMAWAMGYPEWLGGQYAYDQLLSVCHQAQYDYVKASGDPKLSFVALYLHQDRRQDFRPNVISIDGNGAAYDSLHGIDANRNAAAERGYN